MNKKIKTFQNGNGIAEKFMKQEGINYWGGNDYHPSDPFLFHEFPIPFLESF